MLHVKGPKSSVSDSSFEVSGVSSMNVYDPRERKAKFATDDSSDGKPGVRVKFERGERTDKRPPKRSATWKDDDAHEKVIEEGSDDFDSYASDTPAARMRNRKDKVTVEVENFDQANKGSLQSRQAADNTPSTNLKQLKPESWKNSEFTADARNQYAGETSADKLRMRVMNLRKAGKNPWKGSASAVSRSSGPINRKHPEMALIRNNDQVQHLAMKHSYMKPAPQ